MTTKQIIQALERIQLSIKDRDHNGDIIKANIKTIDKIQELINKLNK